ncbi:MAG: hypothetical protein Q4C03_03840, partial [bacterium]|nr:hypothetical protein [bacterium]
MSEKSPRPIELRRPYNSSEGKYPAPQNFPSGAEILTDEYRSVWQDIGKTAIRAEQQESSNTRAELKEVLRHNPNLKKALTTALVVSEITIATLAATLASDLHAQIKSEGLATIEQHIEAANGTDVVLVERTPEMESMVQENRQYAEDFLRDLFGDDLGRQYLENGDTEGPVYLATKIHAALTIENPPEYNLDSVEAE